MSAFCSTLRTHFFNIPTLIILLILCSFYLVLLSIRKPRFKLINSLIHTIIRIPPFPSIGTIGRNMARLVTSITYYLFFTFPICITICVCICILCPWPFFVLFRVFFFIEFVLVCIGSCVFCDVCHIWVLWWLCVIVIALVCACCLLIGCLVCILPTKPSKLRNITIKFPITIRRQTNLYKPILTFLQSHLHHKRLNNFTFLSRNLYNFASCTFCTLFISLFYIFDVVW